jgi:hypothetical protein
MAMLTVHALRYGFALCGFTKTTPDGWPCGHVWVAWNEWDAARASSNLKDMHFCNECRLAVRRDEQRRRNHGR